MGIVFTPEKDTDGFGVAGLFSTRGSFTHFACCQWELKMHRYPPK